MKKSIVFLVLATVLCLGATVARAAESTKELNTTQRDFVREYNRAGGDLGFNFLPTINNSDVKRLEGSVKDAANVKLTEYSSIVLTFQKGGKTISEAMFVGIGDGTNESASFIMSSAVCAMRAFVPKFKKDKFQAMTRGIFKDVLDDKDGIAVILEGVRIKSHISDVTGLTVVITPDTSNATSRKEEQPQEPASLTNELFINRYNDFAHNAKIPIINTSDIKKVKEGKLDKTTILLNEHSKSYLYNYTEKNTIVKAVFSSDRVTKKKQLFDILQCAICFLYSLTGISGDQVSNILDELTSIATHEKARFSMKISNVNVESWMQPDAGVHIFVTPIDNKDK